MELPEENIENLEPLSQFYQLLNIDVSADDSKVRAAYIHLSRIWHQTAIEKWKAMGLEVDESLCSIIYKCVRFAFNCINDADSRRSRLKSLDKVPADFILDEKAKQYKAHFERTCAAHLQPISAVQQASEFNALPAEIFLNILHFLAMPDLMNFGIINQRYRKLTNQLVWKEIIKTGDEKKLFKFCHLFGPNYIPPTLAEIFVSKSGAATKNPPKTITTSNPTGISVFQLYINTRFEVTYEALDRMVHGGAELPEPIKKRDDFKLTSEYFNYLIRDPHDLYITLHKNPGLINHQDENGQTLLFYPVIAAQNLPKDRVQWMIHILTSVPNADLKIVDEDKNSFLHFTTANCIADFKDKTGILNADDHVIFGHVFLKLLDFAIENKFDFNQLNEQGMTVLHIAANFPHNKYDPVYSLNYDKEKTNLDPNCLSSEGATALYYAILRLNFNAIDGLALVTDPLLGAADKQPLFALSRYIQNICHQSKIHLNLVTTKNCLSIRSEFEWLKIQILSNLSLLRQLQKSFLKMAAKIKGQPVFKSDLDWLHATMVQDIIYCYRKNSSWSDYFSMSNFFRVHANNLLRDLSLFLPETAKKLEREIWVFLSCPDNNSSPLHKAILAVFIGELDRVAKEVSDLEAECKCRAPRP